jgi:hypothetical protein
MMCSHGGELERVTYHRTGMGVGQKEPAGGGVAFTFSPHPRIPLPQNTPTVACI